MKSKSSVKYKLKQVKYRIIKKAIRNNLSKKPCNCKNSGLVRYNANEPLFYVCLLDSDKPQEWDGTICDPSIPNTCPFFATQKTKEEIEKEVDDLLSSGDMGKIESVYPDLAELVWVLAGSDEIEEINDEDS